VLLAAVLVGSLPGSVSMLGARLACDLAAFGVPCEGLVASASTPDSGITCWLDQKLVRSGVTHHRYAVSVNPASPGGFHVPYREAIHVIGC